MDGGRCKETLEFVTENAQPAKRSGNGRKGRLELKRRRATKDDGAKEGPARRGEAKRAEARYSMVRCGEVKRWKVEKKQRGN